MAQQVKLFCTQEGLARAKDRVAQLQWAADQLKHLEERSRSLEGLTLPVFEKDWWEEARQKPWQDIYPEINHHTMFAVRDPVHRAYDAAMYFALTDDPQSLGEVQRVLMHYTDYEFFAEHPDVGLNWAVWGMLALYAFDLIYNTLDDDQHKALENFFTRAVAAVMKNDQWWLAENPGGLFNNHYAWHKLFIGAWGVLSQASNLVDYAINSDQGFRDLIEQGTRDDGLWLESSLNYHYTGIIPIADFARILHNSGNAFDLWNHRFANGRNLRDLFTGPVSASFPDRTLPTIGDTYGRRMRPEEVGTYYNAYDAYQLPVVEWMLSHRERWTSSALFCENIPEGEGSAPELYTRIWPEHAYIFLRMQEGRDYWNGDGLSVFVSFDIDGIHSHRDKFGLMAFGRGKHLAVDVEARASEQHAFSANVQAELNRTTLCHNSLMVDRRDHGHIDRKLELIEFIDAEDIKLTTIADTRERVYPGIKMMRTVAVTDDYLLDVFQAVSEEEHLYEYLFHGISDNGAFSMDASLQPYSFPDSGPMRWLRDGRVTQQDGQWSVEAHQGDVRSRLSFAAHPGTQVILCSFPFDDSYSETPYPMLMAGRQAESVVFACVLQAEAGSPAAVGVRVDPGRHGTLRVTVSLEDVGSREFLIQELV